MYDQSKETMSPEERERYLSQRLSEIVEYAYHNAPAVREKLDRAGVAPSQIRSLRDLERIPVTTKDELVRLQRANPPFGGFLTVPPESLQRIFFSPGPIYDPQASTEEVSGAAATAFSALGFTKGDRVMNTFSYHLVPAGLLLDEALRQLGATVVPTGTGMTELLLQIMRDLKVTGYVGTPSFLMTLIKKAEELGYDFRRDFEVKRALVSAEMLPPSLRRSFEEDYGISISDCYGTADLGLLGYQCSHKVGMHIPEDMIVEIVDPATGKQLGPGEVGEVVVTPFNRTYPLIRFGTGDLSCYTDEPCPCGRTSYRLLGILGRVGDAVKVRGMFVHPRQMEEAISRFPQISRFQVIIGRVGHRDEMTLRVELAQDVDREQLSQSIDRSIQEVCRLKVDRIEFLAQGTIPEEHKKLVDERVWE